MILTGTLGERQKQLNLKVREAVSQQVPFDSIQNIKEDTDVDRLYKIDVASNYKNINYLIETLKSGDGLYISRVLKCSWLFDDEHSNLINPDYLHENVFPFMSIKMKKKFLLTASVCIKNENIAADFFNYCLNNNLKHYAINFLISTSPSFKENMFKNQFDTLYTTIEEVTDLKFVIGDNFDLLVYYLEQLSVYNCYKVLHDLRHLFSVDAVRYLNLWEVYCGEKKTYVSNLGLRISKEIMTKHKTRVQDNIILYIKLVHKKMFCKHTTADEAKSYAVLLLPEDSDNFWDEDFKKKYSFILELIPEQERYQYIRHIFKEKYPKSEFEMTSQFYDQYYYELMSVSEREEWALRHLSNPQKTFLSDVSGDDQEYLWYKFVNYDKAISGIKAYILKTPDANKRALIINVLIESARNQEQLEKLFKYYYERHVNESRTNKEDFINKVIDLYDVWDFNETCWAAFEKLLNSIELYNPKDKNFDSYNSRHILENALIYHVLHQTDFPEGLKTFVQSHLRWSPINKLLDRMKNAEQKVILCDYLIQLYEDKIKSRFENKPYDENVKYEIRYYIDFLREVFKYLQKPELPDWAQKYMKLDPDYYNRQLNKGKTITQGKMIRFLKQDPSLAVSSIPSVEAAISANFEFRISTFLRKLRVYFFNDIRKAFLKHFQESVKNAEMGYTNLLSAVYSIFSLADEVTKVQFMNEYTPTDPKIDHSTIDRNFLYIQEGICRFACYSRPPVPLETMLLFIKGDYVKYCLPMFNMYLANLRPQESIQFVEALLNTPVSIQKHGLRLAFKCFSTENLTNLLIKVWNKQKNISLRMVIYTYLLKKIKEESLDEQAELSKLFLLLTSKLHHEDHEDVIDVMVRCNEVPENLRAAYLDAAWKAVSKFPEDKKNLDRKYYCIKNIKKNLDLMNKNQKEFIRIIVDDYLKDIFIEKHIIPSEETNKLTDLYNAKLELTASYIISFEEEGSEEKCLELVKYILQKTFQMWNETSDIKNPTFYARTYFSNFLEKLEADNFELSERQNTSTKNAIFDCILNSIQNTLPIHEIYILIWKLKILIITNKSIESGLKLQTNISNKKELLKTILESYADEIITLVKYFVDKGLFLLSFVNTIAEKLEDYLGNLMLYFSVPIRRRDKEFARIFVATKLLGSKCKEAVLLSVLLLPIPSSDDTLTDLKFAIKNIRLYENLEIQALLHQKMADNGFLKLAD